MRDGEDVAYENIVFVIVLVEFQGLPFLAAIEEGLENGVIDGAVGEGVHFVPAFLKLPGEPLDFSEWLQVDEVEVKHSEDDSNSDEKLNHG